MQFIKEKNQNKKGKTTSLLVYEFIILCDNLGSLFFFFLNIVLIF